MITNANNTGDVIIATPFPTNVTGAGFTAPAATQNGLIEVMYSLATSNSLPLIDNFAMESSYTAGNQLSHYSDERIRVGSVTAFSLDGSPTSWPTCSPLLHDLTIRVR